MMRLPSSRFDTMLYQESQTDRQNQHNNIAHYILWARDKSDFRCYMVIIISPVIDNIFTHSILSSDEYDSFEKPVSYCFIVVVMMLL